jgi:hypothetical protein
MVFRNREVALIFRRVAQVDRASRKNANPASLRREVLAIEESFDGNFMKLPILQVAEVVEASNPGARGPD